MITQYTSESSGVSGVLFIHIKYHTDEGSWYSRVDFLWEFFRFRIISLAEIRPYRAKNMARSWESCSLLTRAWDHVQVYIQMSSLKKGFSNCNHPLRLPDEEFNALSCKFYDWKLQTNYFLLSWLLRSQKSMEWPITLQRSDRHIRWE